MGNGTALALPLTRSKTILRPDPSRVLLRQFEPGDARRIKGIIERIMTLPAGEGHISSITFRCGVIDRDLRIEVDAAAGLLTEPQQIANTVYERPLFQRKLWELGL